MDFILEVNKIDFGNILAHFTNAEASETRPEIDKALCFAFLRHGIPQNNPPFDGLRQYESIVPPFVACIAQLRENWRQELTSGEEIRDAVRIHSGCSEEELDNFESAMRVRTALDEWSLPSQFRLLYRLFNGQELGCNGPLFGRVSVYDTIVQPFLLDLNAITRLINVQEGRSEADLFRKGYFPLVVSNFRMQGRLCQYLCDPESGKVFTPRRDVQRDEYKGAFLIADSILDLFRHSVELVCDTVARLRAGEKMDTISGFQNPVFQRQGVFTVSVRTAFLHHESGTNPPMFHYAYQVAQEMDSDGDEALSMKLERRYWKIDNLKGDIDEVDGPGVIGKYPVLRPGAFHKYASRTSFSVPSGEMSGFFTYQRLAPPFQHKMLRVPLFKLDAPKVDESMGTSGVDQIGQFKLVN